MDKYLTQFTRYLKQLNPADAAEAVDFYTEYLQDGGFATYDEAVAELGTPKQLARKVLADRAVSAPQNDDGSARDQRHHVHSIWLIVLAILSTPITIPLAIAVFALLFAVLATIAAIVLAVVALCVAIIVTGIIILGIGIGVLAQSLSTGIMYIGGGLVIIGGFAMLIPLMVWLVRGLINVTLKFSRWLYRKLTRTSHVEEGQA